MDGRTGSFPELLRIIMLGHVTCFLYTINYKYTIVDYDDNGDYNELRTKYRKHIV